MNTMKKTLNAAILAALLLGTVPAGAVERLAESSSLAPLDTAATAMPVAASAQFQPGLAALPEMPSAAAIDNPLIPAAPGRQAPAQSAAALGEIAHGFEAAAGDKSGDAGSAAGSRNFDGKTRQAGEDRSLPVVIKGSAGARRSRENKDSLPYELAPVTLAAVLMPGTRSTLTLSAESQGGKSLLAANNGADKGYVLMVTANSATDDMPFHMGTITKVVSATVEKGIATVIVEGKREAMLTDQDPESLRIEVMYADLPLGDAKSMTKLIQEAKKILVGMGSNMDALNTLILQDGPRAFANKLAEAAIHLEKLPLEEQQKLLAADSIEHRMDLAVSALRDANPAASAKAAGQEDETAEFTKRIEKSGMPDYAKNTALKELKRMATDKSESQNIRKWLELMVDLPWNRRTTETVDLEKARAILDAEHAGLEDVKEEILTNLAVRAHTGDTKGGVMGFEGPPGVGKTTIAKAWAAATGRELVVISLGGKSDEKFLRGIDRFYQNSYAGALMKKLRHLPRNCVVVFDEADQAGKESANGNLQGALLEILDPEQNMKFADTYLDIPFDLSDIMFIVTGNDFSRFDRAVKDRMDIITFGSYTLAEKMKIGQDHAIRRKLKQKKLPNIQVTDEALRALIKNYTREAGVRDLHRKLDRLFSRVLYYNKVKNEAFPAKIDVADLAKYLGPPKYAGSSVTKNGVGRATGLGVSGLGGSTLSVQASLVPLGSGRLVTRAEMGKAYTDAAMNAWAYVLKHAADFGIDVETLRNHDMHVSAAPPGEIDGPSAGLAMATAMVSAITDVPVRDGVAMTGAIDLYGDAWAIGGLRDKVIAAEREGYKKVLFPITNQGDVPSIPGEVATNVELLGMNNESEVIKQALDLKAKAVPAGYRDAGDGSLYKWDGYGFRAALSERPRN